MGRLTGGALGGYGGKWGMAWAKTTWIFVENPCEGCWPLSCGIGSWRAVCEPGRLCSGVGGHAWEPLPEGRHVSHPRFTHVSSRALELGSDDVRSKPHAR